MNWNQLKRRYQMGMSKEGYKYAPHILMKEFCFTIPNVEFVGYDKDGKAKFKKIKPKQR